MAVNNSLVKQEQKNPLIINFKSGDEDVKLSPKIVKEFLVSGDSDKVTLQEIVMFMNLCKFQHLNPFLKEAHLIKYGNQPATIVTGKSAIEKRANRCENFEGFEAGVVIINTNNELEYRNGALVIDGEQLVGGWADVYVKGYKNPVKMVVSLEEYIGRKKDGTVNAQWTSKPATMIRKVAKMQALREAFPEDFQGMYSAEEMNAGDLSEVPIEQPHDVIGVEAESAPVAEVVQTDDFASIMEE